MFDCPYLRQHTFYNTWKVKIINRYLSHFKQKSIISGGAKSKTFQLFNLIFGRRETSWRLKHVAHTNKFSNKTKVSLSWSWQVWLQKQFKFKLKKSEIILAFVRALKCLWTYQLGFFYIKVIFIVRIFFWNKQVNSLTWLLLCISNFYRLNIFFAGILIFQRTWIHGRINERGKGKSWIMSLNSFLYIFKSRSNDINKGISLRIKGRKNKTERQRDRETERQRDRETERQRDRETERQTDRET